MGFLTAVNGDIYFIDHKVVTTGKLNGRENRFYVSHENYLYHVTGDELKKINELPFEYTSVNFTYDEDSIYAYSDIFNTLDRFDMEGNYRETLYEFAEYTHIRYLAYDSNSQRIFATSPDNAKIYCLDKE